MSRSLESLHRLMAGNQRFANGVRCVDALSSHHRKQELAENGQNPFAIVLCCADSRVPAEMVFDVGLGDLFVVRVAGNIIAPSIIASIEFAAANLGTPLCIVMGHSRCGAIQSAITSYVTGKRPPTDHLQDLTREIIPAVKSCLNEHQDHDQQQLVTAVTARNVLRSVEVLTERSQLLDDLVRSEQLMICGAVYNLHSGNVELIDTAKDASNSQREARWSGLFPSSSHNLDK